MTHGFQHQDRMVGFQVLKSVATPQHGQKAAPKPKTPAEPRSYQPRQGR